MGPLFNNRAATSKEPTPAIRDGGDIKITNNTSTDHHHPCLPPYSFIMVSPRAQRALAWRHRMEEVEGPLNTPPRRTQRTTRTAAGRVCGIEEEEKGDDASSPPLLTQHFSPTSSSKAGQSQTTVSTLTTANTVRNLGRDDTFAEDVDFTGGGGGGFVDTDEEGGDETEPVLPPIKSIFDCPYIVKTVVNDGKLGWDCLWCGKKFSPRHSTRALRHVLKINKSDIIVCSAAIPSQYVNRYKALFENFSERMFARKRSQEEAHDTVAVSQDASVATLLAKRHGIAVSDSRLPVAVGTNNSSSSSFFSVDGTMLEESRAVSLTSSFPKSTRKPPFPLPLMQPSISALIHNMDFWKSNNAIVEMAIAVFFTARLLLILLSSCQGLLGLYVCAALLVMTLFCLIAER